MGDLKEIREFTTEGLEEFEKYINNLNKHEELHKPYKFDRKPFSKRVGVEEMIDDEREFETRLELGKYLCEIFESTNLTRSELVNRTGIWSWLAWVYIDQFVDTSGDKISTKATAKYVCNASWNRYYRHFVSLPYFLVSLHDAENCKIFLESDLDIHKDTVEQLVSKRAIVTNPTLISAANSIYWDEEKKKVARGAASKDSAGSIRRFRTVVNQFRRTYDIQNMTQEEFMDLLPPEFDKWNKSEDGSTDSKDDKGGSAGLREKLGI